MIRVLVAVLVGAAAAFATGAPPLDSEVAKTLTAIDIVPTKEQIDSAFKKDMQPPLQTLVAIANDTNADANVISMRLRAIHALAKYCATLPCAPTEAAHQAVASIIPATKTDTTGSSVLVLRAAIETLGTMRVSSDVTLLEPLLHHASRDVRAATARALRDLCNTHAITPLRMRYSAETTDQVKLAISEALRILAQCSTNQ